MTDESTQYHDNYDAAALKVIERVGKTIVLAIPIAIGKPVGFVNALYKIAKANSEIKLTVITGLTLARPIYESELEKRLSEPVMERLIEDYEDPLYEYDRLKQTIPDNIKIIEFFLHPGKYVKNRYAQENYVSSSYTLVLRDLINYEVNVVAQQIASKNYADEINHPSYSLSSNTDLFYAVVNHFKNKVKKFAIVGEVNNNTPFLVNAALVDKRVFTDLIDTHNYKQIFAMPRVKIAMQDHLIGLYTSCLIRDNSCLQLGIGRMSIAIASALIMRHHHNADYLALLNDLGVFEKFGAIIAAIGDVKPFTKGLYASSEMIGDEYMQLYNAGILKKRVYDHIGLQKLLNQELLSENINHETLDVLLEHHIIHAQLTATDIQFLKEFGIFKSTVQYQDGYLYTADNLKIATDLTSQTTREAINKNCLGDVLLKGKIIDAGFFMGSRDFYSQLHQLNPSTLAQINMTTVLQTNALVCAPKLLALQRQHARFVNSSLMVTMTGGVISDAFNNNKEISGVGGQFDFAYMGQYLENARFIINCRATRNCQDGLVSNIVWEYPQQTLPRFLRDIVITEYGIADCRSKIDAEVIKDILAITDSNFQDKLLKLAKSNLKISNEYQIPAVFTKNNCNAITAIFQPWSEKGYCQAYPFGSDLTAEEDVLKLILLKLKCMQRRRFILTVLYALLFFASDGPYTKYLHRMDLIKPRTIKNLFYKKLIKLMVWRYQHNKL